MKPTQILQDQASKGVVWNHGFRIATWRNWLALLGLSLANILQVDLNIYTPSLIQKKKVETNEYIAREL